MNSDGWMTVKQFLKGHNSTTLSGFFSGNDDEQWLNNMLFGLKFLFFLILDLNKTNRYT
jgi:hypothetical protein